MGKNRHSRSVAEAWVDSDQESSSLWDKQLAQVAKARGSKFLVLLRPCGVEGFEIRVLDLRRQVLAQIDTVRKDAVPRLREILSALNGRVLVKTGDKGCLLLKQVFADLQRLTDNDIASALGRS